MIGTRKAPELLRVQLGSRVAIVAALAASGAIAIEALWTIGWRGSWSADPRLIAVFALFGVTACHFPVELTPRFKTNVATAVNFAILLLFAAPIAVGLVGISVLVGNGTLALRKNRDGRRRRGVYDTIFNAAQMTIAAGVGVAVLYSLRAETSLANPTLADAWAIPLAALAMYVTNTGLVALMVGVHSGRNAFDVWLATQRLDAASESALYLIGFITLIVASAYVWAPFVMVVPTAVVYLATKRAVMLNQQTIEAVEAMADMVDLRDRYTADHSKRVAANAAAIAAAMGMKPDDVATVRLAARVHDLGKIGLPDSILQKEGKLEPAEFALVKEHPRRGHEILAKFPQYRRGRDIVLAHHERFDGKGYPHGLTAGRIPVGAQIVAVADALDAMTSDRPYRAALPLHQAMTELRLGRATQWSPTVVDTVERLLNVEKRELAFGDGVGQLQMA
ncbi:MAG: HD-GYP domain-containing protein [Candidatus Dormibacterales bacterium]